MHSFDIRVKENLVNMCAIFGKPILTCCCSVEARLHIQHCHRWGYSFLYQNIILSRITDARHLLLTRIVFGL